MIELTPPQRRTLRAAAHHLKPVVSISQKGLQPSVLSEIEQSLKSHELIKVRLYGVEREARAALISAICMASNCAEVQQIGNILVLWREGSRPSVEVSQMLELKIGRKPANKKQLAAATDARMRRRRAT